MKTQPGTFGAINESYYVVMFSAGEIANGSRLSTVAKERGEGLGPPTRKILKFQTKRKEKGTTERRRRGGEEGGEGGGGKGFRVIAGARYTSPSALLPTLVETPVAVFLCFPFWLYFSTVLPLGFCEP